MASEMYTHTLYPPLVKSKVVAMAFSGVRRGSTIILLLLNSILVLQGFLGANSREINSKIHVHESMHMHQASNKDPKAPELQQFFRLHNLKSGKTFPIYFPIKNHNQTPPLLSRKEAESLPFSSSQLPEILNLFSIPDGSPQAEAMGVTLSHCEFEPLKGESKFCANSLESLLDSARAVLGPNVDMKVETTKHLSKGLTSLLQNYTILGDPKEILAPRIIGCHPLPYPYSVYYCHSQESDNKLFKVDLVGENGWRVEALGICHMDTSQWDPDHVAFLVLNTKPGKSPVCHFFPDDNLVWYPSAYDQSV